jgi:hypothetical protein
VSYRDDRGADRARIEALEAELARSKAKIAELEGRRGQALALASGGALAASPKGTAGTLLGAPLDLALYKELEGAYPSDKFEDLVEVIRQVVREPGRTEVLKTSLTWASTTQARSIGPLIVVMVSVRDGVTKITVGDKLGQAAGAIYGGIGGGVGGGTIIVPIGIGLATMPVLIPVLLVGWLGSAWWGCRKLFQRTARKRATHLQQVFDAVVAEVAKGI